MFANYLKNNHVNSLCICISLNLTRPLWKSSKDVRANVFKYIFMYVCMYVCNHFAFGE